MSDYWQKVQAISNAVDNLRSSPDDELVDAAAVLTSACRDMAGGPVVVRWSQDEKPIVNGVAVRRVKHVNRDDAGNIESTEDVWQSEVNPGAVVQL